ncbi:MAG: hypothetical protein M0P27_10375, partial [Bacteroidales bacterium]|nr:hypothetical protein [Bacteroidales bacterium]
KRCRELYLLILLSQVSAFCLPEVKDLSTNISKVQRRLTISVRDQNFLFWNPAPIIVIVKISGG